MLIVGGGREVGVEAFFSSHLVIFILTALSGEVRECYGGFSLDMYMIKCGLLRVSRLTFYSRDRASTGKAKAINGYPSPLQTMDSGWDSQMG